MNLLSSHHLACHLPAEAGWSCSACPAAVAASVSSVKPLSRARAPALASPRYGTFAEAAKAAHSAERAASANARRAGRRSAARLGHKYYCELCSRGFDRMKQYEEHVAGKKHRAAVDAPILCGPSSAPLPGSMRRRRRRLATSCVPPLPRGLDDFLEGLPRRSRSRGQRLPTRRRCSAAALAAAASTRTRTLGRRRSSARGSGAICAT